VAENVAFYTEVLLERTPPMAGGFGPEDGQARGGDAGADPGNHPGEVTPPSKITGTR
jgi:hypothetical protein